MPVYIKNYSYSPAKLYPVDDAHPEECDYDLEVISDLSGKDITNKTVWQIDNGDICSEEEMLEYFNNEYVSEIVDEREYQKGKKWIIEFFGYTEKDFENHPTILKINVPCFESSCQYALETIFDPIGYEFLPEDWEELDDDKLAEIGFENFNEFSDDWE